MNIALIFPGQGSQYIGMGKDFFDNSEASKQIFNNLDETMGLKLSELIFNGSEEELSKTTLPEFFEVENILKTRKRKGKKA